MLIKRRIYFKRLKVGYWAKMRTDNRTIEGYGITIEEACADMFVSNKRPLMIFFGTIKDGGHTFSFELINRGGYYEREPHFTLDRPR